MKDEMFKNTSFHMENRFFDYESDVGKTLQIEENPMNISHSSNEMSMTNADYLVSFMTGTKSYCVGIVDMVNSTKIAASMETGKISRYYQIFLNSMSKVVSRFGGQVIKNVGDCLVFYFPESSNYQKKFGFMACLECCITMTEIRDIICQKLSTERLPPIDYRISADYGPMVVMKANNSDIIDMIGPPLNMCSKINNIAKQNDFVIGGDLFQMVKNINDFKFYQERDFSLGFKQSYPVYSVRRKQY